MSIRFPGTRTLKLIEAAGRHLNFSRAAAELGLTPAAVSHQVKEIEDQLGFELFARTSRTMQLTAAGVVIYEATVEALADLDAGLVRARRMTRKSQQLKVTTSASFAARWLVPRLELFRRRHPDVDIRIDVSTVAREFARDDIDVAIRFGPGGYPGLRSDRLFEIEIFPVCSPRLLKSAPPLKEPRDLLRYTLVDVEWSKGGVTWPNWRMWMAAAGVSDFDDDAGIHFEDSSHAIQAAVDGNVVALADFTMVADDLSVGRLVRPFDLGVKVSAGFAYHVVSPLETADTPPITAFRTWLVEEAQKTQATAFA
ncbi:MAG TPA: transcriptional regulator GcvA [Sinorhizobium sp.]|nr:transcriptional regulator GcvA [Sinorhizobium sp.]